VLVVPHRFYTHQQARRADRHVYASRTRFIPAGIVERFEVRSWPPVSRTSQVGRPRTTATVDLGARMRDMWRGTGT
jgi:DNA helicase II / ATP-dependent DNA helicase PcrA